MPGVDHIISHFRDNQQISMNGEAKEDGPKSVATHITQARRSRRLEQKREGQVYQTGKVASLATKRRALLLDYEQGNDFSTKLTSKIITLHP